MVSLHFLKKQRNRHEKKILSTNEWPEYIVNLDEKNFTEFIRKYPLSVIEFWAPWCGPCKNMAPRLRRLSKMYAGKVAFGKLNIQDYQDIAKKYKIVSIPHLLFFSNGDKIFGLIGMKSVGDVKQVLENFLKKKGGTG